MKSMIFFATVALSSTWSVFGAPATTSTLLTSRVPHPQVTSSNTTTTPNTDTPADNWACLAFSQTTGSVGAGFGVDESSATSAAIEQCGSDCTVATANGGTNCIKNGCFAFTRGVPTIHDAPPIFVASGNVNDVADEEGVIEGLIAESESGCLAGSMPGTCGGSTFFCSGLDFQ
jgi:hypothetical protein